METSKTTPEGAQTLGSESAEGSEQINPGGATVGVPGGLATQLANQRSAEAQPGSGGDSGAPPIPRKKIGRPIKHGRYSKAAGSDGKTAVSVDGQDRPADSGPGTLEQGQMDGGPDNRIVVPPELFSRVVRESLTASSNGLTAGVGWLGKRAGLTEQDMAEKIDDLGMSDPLKDTLTELSPHICREWGIDPKMSPTVLALILGGPWLGTMTATCLGFLSIAKERQELLKRQKQEEDALQ